MSLDDDKKHERPRTRVKWELIENDPKARALIVINYYLGGTETTMTQLFNEHADMLAAPEQASRITKEGVASNIDKKGGQEEYLKYIKTHGDGIPNEIIWATVYPLVFSHMSKDRRQAAKLWSRDRRMRAVSAFLLGEARTRNQEKIPSFTAYKVLKMLTGVEFDYGAINRKIEESATQISSREAILADKLATRARADVVQQLLRGESDGDSLSPEEVIGGKETGERLLKLALLFSNIKSPDSWLYNPLARAFLVYMKDIRASKPTIAKGLSLALGYSHRPELFYRVDEEELRGTYSPEEAHKAKQLADAARIAYKYSFREKDLTQRDELLKSTWHRIQLNEERKQDSRFRDLISVIQRRGTMATLIRLQYGATNGQSELVMSPESVTIKSYNIQFYTEFWRFIESVEADLLNAKDKLPSVLSEACMKATPPIKIITLRRNVMEGSVSKPKITARVEFEKH